MLARLIAIAVHQVMTELRKLDPGPGEHVSCTGAVTELADPVEGTAGFRAGFRFADGRL